jgi:hypothetical protein
MRRRRRVGGGLLGAASSVDPLITRNAVNLFGAGHSTGSGIATSTGATVNTTATFVNRSGAPITIGSLAFTGWLHTTTTGNVNVGNDVPVTANIEYPVGVTFNSMLQSGGATITIPNGGDILTDQVTLATPIPAGATFNVNISCTISAGLFYLGTVSGTTGHSFGLAGVCTTALRSTLKKEAIYAIGDSIMTNNGGAMTTAATNQQCPSLQMSISGGRASYLASTFSKMASIAGKIGCTRFVSNFGTNDLSAGRTLVQLQADLQSMRTLAAAQSVLFAQCTLLPKTSRETVTTSAQAAAGNIMTLTVPDGSRFVVGGTYTVAGAGDASYNGSRFCIGIVGNVLSFICPTGTPATTTGTVTIASRLWSMRELQTPATGFEAGAGSDRGLQNAYIRAGNFDSYIDWGDACEVTRDEGKFAGVGEKSELVATQSVTVTSGTPRTTTRFQITGTWPNSCLASGIATFSTGLNIGELRGGNGNTGGDFTVTSAYTNIPGVGDALWVAAGSYASDDGTHPRIATGSAGSASYRGGQAMIVNSAIAWLQGLLA